MKGTIKSKSDVERLFQSGRRSSSSLMVIICGDNPTDEVGLCQPAFIAGKKLGCAPFRNRCKRVLRSAAAYLDKELLCNQVIFMARRKVAYAPFTSVVEQMEKQLKELGVIK